MLQQIIRDMYIDPLLLAELDEEQKQILFCKMREEQVRRWKEREAKLEEEEMKKKPKLPPKPGTKRVTFRQGADGNPWTWVMGEHKNDLSIEEILEREARVKASTQAELEAELLRKQEKIVPNSTEASSEVVVQLHEEGQSLPQNDLMPALDELMVCVPPPLHAHNSLPWLERQKQKVKYREDYLKKVKEQRSTEIYQSIVEARQKSLELAEKNSKLQEQEWQEQERKAREAEKQIREIARRAREEHKRTSIQDADVYSAISYNLSSSAKSAPGNLPSQATSKSKDAKIYTREEVLAWFNDHEYPRGAVSDKNRDQIAPWFHGPITRQEAERILSRHLPGSFLVRLHERIKGYVISYRAPERCKHFLIDASAGYCQFFGTNQIVHSKLSDLVHFHMANSITSTGQEMLLSSCVQSTDDDSLGMPTRL